MSWVLEDGPIATADGQCCWPIGTLINNGFLWGFNTFVAHPRGYAVFAHFRDDAGMDFVGLQVARSDNGGPLVYPRQQGPQEMGIRFAQMFPSPHAGRT